MRDSQSDITPSDVEIIADNDDDDFDEYYERIKAIDEMQKSQLIQANIVKFEWVEI